MAHTLAWLGQDHTVVGLTAYPSKEDDAGRLFAWWRASVHSNDGETACAVWVREQIGGFGVPMLTLEEFKGDKNAATN